MLDSSNQKLRELLEFTPADLPLTPTHLCENDLKLSNAAEERRAILGLETGEVFTLFELLTGAVDLIAGCKDQGVIDDLLGTASLKFETEDSLNRCYELFNHLSLKPSKRARGEGNYGLACLAAIQGDGPQAAAYLRVSGDAAGEETLEYVNRASLDSDFDTVRSDDPFKALLQRTKAASSATGLTSPLSL